MSNRFYTRNLKSTCIILVAIALQPMLSPCAFADDSIVKFPRRSIGTCCFVQPTTKKSSSRTSTDFEARGIVKVPAGQGIGLKINYDLSESEDFTPLKSIDPKLFMRFNANAFPLSDKQLALLSEMTNMEHLTLARTDLCDASVEYLKGMKHLKSIDLRCTMITSKGVEKLCSYCPELYSLNLGKNALDDSSVAAISKLKSLLSLNLSYTGQRGTNLEMLANLPSLTSLDLCNNKIHDRFVKKIASIKSLEDLDLMDNPLTYAGLKELKPLKKLKKLTLRTKQFSPGDLKQLRTSCLPANCTIKDGSREGVIPTEVFAPLHSPFNRGDGIDKR